MQIMQSRRDFLAGPVGRPRRWRPWRPASARRRGPPETTTIRLPKIPGICIAPRYVAEELLRAEGLHRRPFRAGAGGPSAQMARRGELDFAELLVAAVAFRLDAGEPITCLAGVHSGCYELFAHEPIRTIAT